MGDFLNFNKMITPTIIKFIFWVGSGFSVLAGLILLFQGGMESFFGLVVMVVGPFMTRIYCELLIVLFKMHEALQTIASKSDSERISA
jgi:hypothetical protein